MFKKLCLIAGLLISSQLALAELVVIVNPSNTNALEVKEIQRIFLGKDKKFSDGSESIPINQSQENRQRQSFDEEILGRSSSQVSAYWSKLVFTGKGIPPKEVASDAEVIELVKSNPSVIGYVNKSSVDSSVRTIEL